jgi:prepilin signal peptidase PulO-like enzyme (type II secretory pathway)
LDFKILANSLFSAILVSAFFLTIVLISGGKWLGFGDVKLVFFLGLLLGFPNILVAFFFSFFLGAIIGIGLVIVKKKTLKSEIPFGPFLVSGTFIAFFWGKEIIEWYLYFI